MVTIITKDGEIVQVREADIISVSNGYDANTNSLLPWTEVVIFNNENGKERLLKAENSVNNIAQQMIISIQNKHKS